MKEATSSASPSPLGARAPAAPGGERSGFAARPDAARGQVVQLDRFRKK